MGTAERVVTIPYAPRPLQLAIHSGLDANRFGVVVCHRRFGKTVMAINHALRAALTCQKPRGRFAYIGPTYRQAKAVAWDYLQHYSRPVPGVSFHQSELRADYPNGAQVRLYGADNPDALRGIYLDGAILDEYGLMDGRVWSEVIRPALADRMGWALFIGTPNGKNAFWDIADLSKRTPGWMFAEHRASATGIIDAGELEAAKANMTADEYAQEFECSFEASVKGAIYAAELTAARESKPARIGRVPVDPAVPVHTAWDLGIGDSTAIWFVQQVGSEIHLVDYHEASGEGLPYYAKVLQDKGYVYSRHLGPHDIEARELSTGLSRREVAKNLGIDFEVVPRSTLEDGIHAARMMFARCWFDEERCRPGLEMLQNYRWDYNTRLGEFKPTPVHDFASHGADAFRTMAMGLDKAPEWRPINRRRRDLI